MCTVIPAEVDLENPEKIEKVLLILLSSRLIYLVNGDFPFFLSSLLCAMLLSILGVTVGSVLSII